MSTQPSSATWRRQAASRVRRQSSSGDVEQVGGQQHGVEAPAELQLLDAAEDGLGAVDALQHLRRLVDGDHRMAKGEQRVGDPPDAGAELEDRGALGDRRVDDPRLAAGRQRGVELDRGPVRRDHSRAVAVGALRAAGHAALLRLGWRRVICGRPLPDRTGGRRRFGRRGSAL
jgi:hypothetical protein